MTRRGPRAGLSVALLGPDGSGKSTLAEGLARRLPGDARVWYMGAFRSTPPEWRLRRLPGVAFAVRLHALRRAARQAQRHRARGGVAVFDRYTHDGLLAAHGWRQRVKHLVVAHSCPPPDLVLLLDADPELLFSRKGEHSPAELAGYRERYRQVVAALPRHVVLDAAQPAEQVLDAALAAVRAARHEPADQPTRAPDGAP